MMIVKKFLALLISFSMLASATLLAEEATFFGDFEDGFGAAGSYESSIPYDPSSGALVFTEMVLGLPKFDPSLGTLTDITVFVLPSGGSESPIFYTVGGDLMIFEEDAFLPEFSATIALEGEASLNYVGASLFDSILADPFFLSGGVIGAMGDGEAMGPVELDGADGELTGSESIIGSVDLSDFVGPGMVETLFVELFVNDTADFSTDNSTAFAELGFDVFDLDSGADDDVVGITYTYTVPEPTSLSLLSLAVIGFASKRRRI